MHGLQYVAQKSSTTTLPLRSFSFCTFPSKPVQLISGTGFNGRDCASFACMPFTEIGLFPTETGAAAGRQAAMTRQRVRIVNRYIVRKILHNKMDTVMG